MARIFAAVVFLGLSLAGAEASQDPDFLFGAPRFSVGARFGWNLARADSDIFEFFREELTVGGRDFDAPTIAFDFAFLLNQHVDVVLGAGFTRAKVTSESRKFIGTDDLPITQETRLSQAPLTASLKFYLTPRGREVSQYAWVPHTAAPFVGGGGGLVWYKLEQTGEFVDSEDLSIFPATLSSPGWALTAHVFGGLEVSLNPNLFLTLEARYAWADSALNEDVFEAFNPIDLTGLGITAGVSWLIK
jgi:hypothetical protein